MNFSHHHSRWLQLCRWLSQCTPIIKSWWSLCHLKPSAFYQGWNISVWYLMVHYVQVYKLTHSINYMFFFQNSMHGISYFDWFVVLCRRSVRLSDNVSMPVKKLATNAAKRRKVKKRIRHGKENNKRLQKPWWWWIPTIFRTFWTTFNAKVVEVQVRSGSGLVWNIVFIIN